MIELAPITGLGLLRLVRFDGGDDPGLPAPGHAETRGTVRIGWIEPGTWLLRCALAEVEAVMADHARDGAAIVEVTGALAGIAITGPGWRERLMTGGVFDAEGPGFAVGRLARTVMHHAPLLLDRVAAERVEAFVPASHARDFAEHWGMG